MKSVIELFYRGDSFLLEPRFFKENHKEETEEIERDIEYDKKRLKKILMSGEALSEKEAKEIIREIEQDYESLSFEYGLDDFASGCRIGATLMMEILNG